MPYVFWFTGLSGAGKTTIANAAAGALQADGLQIKIIDGDDVRACLHRHLGFSREDILENNRLITSLCVEALSDFDVIFVPIISPLKEGREKAREQIGENKFRLVYFSAPLSHVAAADVKGLYRRATTGEIQDMIGVAAENPFEPPSDSDIEIDISTESEADCVLRFVNYIRRECDA